MKKVYATTDETRSVLIGHEAEVAKAKGCDPSYVYNIKNTNEPDPYAPFREWFQDCANGGGNVRAYLHDLEAIACRAERGLNGCEVSATDKLLKKLDTDAESSHVLAAANADNQWDPRECDQILDACDRVDSETRELREMALMRKNATREWAAGVVTSRRAANNG
jgi:hypothetical protein